MEVRAAEFFSGIGGMHYALKTAAIPRTRVVAAFDISEVANRVYAHNHGLAPATVGVDHLDGRHYDGLGADLWTLSPPCQPYTRGGLRRDDADPRAAGLLHLVAVLAAMARPPAMLVLENVLGFEGSNSRARLVSALHARGYLFREFLVAPTDAAVAIPNARLRYYLIAWRAKASNTPAAPVPAQHIFRSIREAVPEAEEKPVPTIAEFLGETLRGDESFAVPMRALASFGDFCHDVVRPCDTACSTFTRAYGSHYIRGTGSFLQTARLELAPGRDYATNDLGVLPTLGLRFFRPDEVARLHGLNVPGEPRAAFAFPEGVTRLQQYRLLGNSLNVRVVAVLLAHLYDLAGFNA